MRIWFTLLVLFITSAGCLSHESKLRTRPESPAPSHSCLQTTVYSVPSYSISLTVDGEDQRPPFTLGQVSLTRDTYLAIQTADLLDLASEIQEGVSSIDEARSRFASFRNSVADMTPPAQPVLQHRAATGNETSAPLPTLVSNQVIEAGLTTGADSTGLEPTFALPGNGIGLTDLAVRDLDGPSEPRLRLRVTATATTHRVSRTVAQAEPCTPLPPLPLVSSLSCTPGQSCVQYSRLPFPDAFPEPFPFPDPFEPGFGGGYLYDPVCAEEPLLCPVQGTPGGRDEPDLDCIACTAAEIACFSGCGIRLLCQLSCLRTFVRCARAACE